MIRYYDLDGNQVDEATGVMLMAATDPIARDTIMSDGGPIEVSTIFLSADHNFPGDGPLRIFETMTFWNGEENDCKRWSTLTEAREGHAAIVAKLQGGVR